MHAALQQKSSCYRSTWLTISPAYAVSKSEGCRSASNAAQRTALQFVVERRLGCGERERRGLCSGMVGNVVERSFGASRERSGRRDAASGCGGVARRVQWLRNDWRIAAVLVPIVRLAENARDGEGGGSRLGSW